MVIPDTGAEEEDGTSHSYLTQSIDILQPFTTRERP